MGTTWFEKRMARLLVVSFGSQSFKMSFTVDLSWIGVRYGVYISDFGQ